MRDSLIKALALHAGQELTPAVARSILDLLYPDNAIDCTQWASTVWHGVTIQAEPWANTHELQDLHSLHASELGEPCQVQNARLDELQRAGRLLTVTARRDGVLVGLLRCFLIQHHRTGEMIGRDDLCHIVTAERGGMLAVRLGDYIERCLVDLGVTWAEARMRVDNGTPALGRRRGYEPFAQHVRKRLLTN